MNNILTISLRWTALTSDKKGLIIKLQLDLLLDWCNEILGHKYYMLQKWKKLKFFGCAYGYTVMFPAYVKFRSAPLTLTVLFSNFILWEIAHTVTVYVSLIVGSMVLYMWFYTVFELTFERVWPITLASIFTLCYQ